MLWISDVLQNVPLRNSQMLEQLPGGVRSARWRNPAKIRRPTVEGRGYIRVRIAAGQQFDEVSAQCGVLYGTAGSVLAR
jgi:hypothetical protein